MCWLEDLYFFTHKQEFQEFTHYGAIKKKHPVSSSSLDGKLMSSMENGQTALSWQKGWTLIITVCNCWEQNASQNAPWGRWVTATEDHTRFHCYQPRTESWGCSVTVSPKQTVKDCKMYKMNKKGLLRHTDGRVRIWHRQIPIHAHNWVVYVSLYIVVLLIQISH